MLENWARAYPPDIFKPMSSEDWHQHNVALTEACRAGRDVRSGSSAAADCMRYVVTQMKESADLIADR